MTAEERDALFRSSVIVTGTHYSTTTLVGRLIAAAPEFHLVHEPLNRRPMLSYESLEPERWYQYYDDQAYPELRQALRQYMFFDGGAGRALRRLGRIRRPSDLLRVGRYVADGIPRRLRPRRAVFKDPFLAFSARTLQQQDGLPVLVTVRHPCAFAESLGRRARQFDFRSLQQPALLALIPEHAGQIDEFAARPKPVLEQAALLWTVVYGFALRYLEPHPRTRIVRQEDLVADPVAVADDLLGFVGGTRDGRVDALIAAAFAGATRPAARPDYVHRDPAEALGKWKGRLDEAERASVMAIAGEVAGRFGYESADG